jgi:hypothetical protein
MQRGFSLLLFLTLWFIAPRFSYSQDRAELRFIAESRYDVREYGNDYKRLQGAFRNWTKLRLNDELSLHAHLSSGPRFQTRWSTATDFKPPVEQAFLRIVFRQLYLQYESNRWKLQAGTIPPVKNAISSMGLEGTGWVDGLRIVHTMDETWTVELVAGGINDLEQPNLFVRPRTLNFLEVELNKQLSKPLRLDLRSEILDEDIYIGSELAYKATQRHPQLSAEILHNTKNSTSALFLSLTYDLNKLYADRENSGMRVFAMYSNSNSEIGLRGELSDDFYDFGAVIKIEMEGPIHRPSNTSWFVRQVFMKSPRSLVGIRYDLQGSIK